MKQLGVQYSYTLEASVCGTLTGSDSSSVQTHFTIQDYQDIGYIFCETLANFFNSTPSRVSFFFCFSCLRFAISPNRYKDNAMIMLIML